MNRSTTRLGFPTILVVPFKVDSVIILRKARGLRETGTGCSLHTEDASSLAVFEAWSRGCTCSPHLFILPLHLLVACNRQPCQEFRDHASLKRAGYIHHPQAAHIQSPWIVLMYIIRYARLAEASRGHRPARRPIGVGCASLHLCSRIPCQTPPHLCEGQGFNRHRHADVHGGGTRI